MRFWAEQRRRDEINAGIRRRARSREADQRAARLRAAQRIVSEEPVRWSYFAVRNYVDILCPPETECGRWVQPQGATHYFDTEAERDAFEAQHLIKIKTEYEERKVRDSARRAAQSAEWERKRKERNARLLVEQQAYDEETRLMCCLSRTFWNLHGWWVGTHTWRGVRLYQEFNDY